MDGTRKFEKLSKGGRSVSWTQHHWVRCTDLESAMELEDSFEPSARYVGDVETGEPTKGRRSQPRRMGKDARESQRELQELQRGTITGDD